jgi:hypothetical protein
MDSRLVANESDGAEFVSFEQAERCRRLARGSTDPVLRDGLLNLADEYAARAGIAENASEDDDATA